MALQEACSIVDCHNIRKVMVCSLYVFYKQSSKLFTLIPLAIKVLLMFLLIVKHERKEVGSFFRGMCSFTRVSMS